MIYELITLSGYSIIVKIGNFLINIDATHGNEELARLETAGLEDIFQMIPTLV